MPSILRLAAVFILVLRFDGPALEAQEHVELAFGVRGGIPLGSTLKTGSTCYFCSQYSFRADVVDPGMTIGLAGHHWGIALDAVRRGLHFDSQSLSVTGPVFGTGTSRTNAHGWEFPLLVTYRIGRQHVRPIAGAGIGHIGKAKGVTDSDTTSPSGTPTHSQFAYNLRGSAAYYVTGGVEASQHYIVFRPEFRYTRRKDASFTSIATRANLWEIVFTLGFRPMTWN